MYGNQVKNEWRERVWGAASDMCEDKSNWVLTLAGNRFLDRKVAPKYGFNCNKIVGIDSDVEVCKRNSSFGRTVLNLPLSDAIAAWDKPVSVINLDFCSNISGPINSAKSPIATLNMVAGNRRFQGSAVILNVAAGREANYRQYIKALKEWDQSFHNRALCAIALAGVQLLEFTQLLERATPTRKFTTLDRLHLVHKAMSDACIISGSYVANRMPMHWCVYNNADYIPWYHVDGESYATVKGHIAAKMAWHTMRQRQ